MKIRTIIPLLFVGASLISCRDHDVTPSDKEVNQWIYTTMKQYYYWTNAIPEKPDLNKDPESLFRSLLNTYDATANPNGDRFSWIQKDAEVLKASLSGENTSNGMDYRVLKLENSDQVFGLVIYTLPNSPAAHAGIKRGDYFTRIDGQLLSTANYKALLAKTGAKEFTLATRLNGQFNELPEKKSLTPVTLQEDPVYFDSLYTFGGKKIAYLVYHQFITGPKGDATALYDKKLDQYFGTLKQGGVNELIIDLRYNTGGQVSSAVNLASLIGKDINDKKVFSTKEYNSTITPVLKKEYGESFFTDHFKNKTQNIGTYLSRIIILTSGNTASASEMLINSLKPYMNVVLVGDKTVGKNVASITLSDKKKRHKWGLQPIVAKYFNSQGRSDFTSGFQPDITQREGSALFPYGDLRDPLLGSAMNIIGVIPARKQPSAPAGADLEIDNSISEKTGGSNVFFNFSR